MFMEPLWGGTAARQLFVVLCHLLLIQSTGWLHRARRLGERPSLFSEGGGGFNDVRLLPCLSLHPIWCTFTLQWNRFHLKCSFSLQLVFLCNIKADNLKNHVSYSVGLRKQSQTDAKHDFVIKYFVFGWIGVETRGSVPWLLYLQTLCVLNVIQDSVFIWLRFYSGNILADLQSGVCKQPHCHFGQTPSPPNQP